MCKRLNLHIFQVLKWFYRPNFGGTANIKQCAKNKIRKGEFDDQNVQKGPAEIPSNFQILKATLGLNSEKVSTLLEAAKGIMQPTRPST